MIDVNELTLAANARQIDIKHPYTGESTPFKITVLGIDSSDYRAAMNESIDQDGSPEDQTIGFLRRIIVNWSGIQGPNGEPLPCNDSTVESLLSCSPNIANQIQAFIGDRENFTKG